MAPGGHALGQQAETFRGSVAQAGVSVVTQRHSGKAGTELGRHGLLCEEDGVGFLPHTRHRV